MSELILPQDPKHAFPRMDPPLGPYLVEHVEFREPDGRVFPFDVLREWDPNVSVGAILGYLVTLTTQVGPHTVQATIPIASSVTINEIIDGWEALENEAKEAAQAQITRASLINGGKMGAKLAPIPSPLVTKGPIKHKKH